MRPGVAGGEPEMVVRETVVLGDVGAGPGKHEDAGLAVAADLIVDQGRPAVGPVHDDPRQDAIGRTARADGAGGVQDVHGRVLIAADVAESDPHDAAARDGLEIQRPAAPAEDLHRIPAGADQEDGPVYDDDLVLIDAGPDEDLVLRLRVLQRGAGTFKSRRVRGVHDQRVATGWIGWRLVEDVHPWKGVHSPLSGVKHGVHSRARRFGQAVSRRRVWRGVVLMSDLLGWMWVLTGIGFFILVVVVFFSQMRK